MSQLGSKIDRWIHGFLPATAQGLALSRIFFAAFFLITGIPTFSWVSRNPPGFFDPPTLSAVTFLPTFPPAWAMQALDVFICVLLVFVLVGFKTKASSVLLTLTWLLGNSFRYSFGLIDHTILTVIAPLVMAFSGWGAAYSIDSKMRKATGEIEAWPLSLLALLVGFGFFSAGFPKLFVWADFNLSTQGARSWLVTGWYRLGRNRLLAPLFLSINNPYFWEMMDLTAVTFETTFIFSLVKRGLFRTYLFIAVMFHLANLLMLNIGFITILPVYVIFAPWERIVPRLPRGLLRAVDRLTSVKGMVAVLALFLPLYFFEDSVSINTAANAFSHLGIAFDRIGVLDYNWVLGLILHPLAAVVALILAGMPRALAQRAAPMQGTAGNPVVLFDGVCNLCNAYVDFLIRRDRRHRLMFASLQSEAGKLVTQAAPDAAVPDTFYTMFLLDSDGLIYGRSDAILKSVTLLGGWYRILELLWLFPRPLRDIGYRAIARLRYRLFGTRQSCRVPTPQERAMFLVDFSGSAQPSG
ncbi:MAG TPA: DCC1-like thiol-disulfide oxidoreductase family protein [Gemmatimonadaceae bacterium]|nr:DCC1-like thiol-disulfide oxidoreductase family protein [Gemmatimonadaceae bacterium]